MPELLLNPSTPPPLRALIIIVAFEAGVHLQRCIDALESQTFRDWRAVVWDNASSDGAAQRLSISDRVSTVFSPTNLGFAAANNRAAALLPSTYVVTLNPDAFPEPDWLMQLVTTADQFGAAAVGSIQLDDLDPSKLDGAGDCMSIAGIAWRGGYGQARALAPTEICEIFAPCAAAALYRRDVFEAERGYDERFFCYYEDVDLGFRIRLGGGICLLDPGAVVRHVGSATTRQISGFAEYYGCRNRIWSFARNMPLVLLPIAVPAHLIVTLYILARSPKLWAVRWRAVKDALAGLGPSLMVRRQHSGALISLLFALTWSPVALSRRAIKARRLQTAVVQGGKVKKL